MKSVVNIRARTSNVFSYVLCCLLGLGVSAAVPLHPDASAVPDAVSSEVELDRGSLAFRQPVSRQKSGLETNVWWGQPVNPKDFWHGKTIWLDAPVIDAIRQRGRRMPPPAFNDPALPLELYSSLIDDPAPEARDRLYKHERRFWAKWSSLLPKPPGDILARQKRAATDYFWLQSSQYSKLAQDNPMLSASPEVFQQRLCAIQLSAIDEGFPFEAFQEETLFWTYVFDKRQEYEKRTKQGMEDGKSVSPEFARLLGVDTKVILRPLTDAEEKAGSMWKAKYVKRLLREEVDQSYVSAYCQAWRLPLGKLKTDARAEVEGLERRELDMPAVLKDRTQSMRAKHEAKVLSFLSDGQENAARLLAKRYWLDFQELQQKAGSIKETTQVQKKNQTQGPEQLLRWRKKRLQKMIAHGDKEEAQAKADQWGIPLDEIEKQ